jgi:hypothetical protein
VVAAAGVEALISNQLPPNPEAVARHLVGKGLAVVRPGIGDTVVFVLELEEKTNKIKALTRHSLQKT